MVAKRVGKQLLSEDGWQATCQLGLINGEGVMVYMFDEGTKYLRFDPANERIADLEAQVENLASEVSWLNERLAMEGRLAKRGVQLSEELFANGKFGGRVRSNYQSKLYRLRENVEEVCA